ncbi:hypothetical protein [Nonomuraea sp. NPDC048916]|uniref:hypothetical protein n=1 Tax=Nonomuraea sp. NPDC048916 TaxID=3154232 RepID=UPI0033FE379E
MRLVSRILIGAAAAASMVAVGAPVAANAATTSAANATTATAPTSSPYFEDDWGPYFSSDHKAKAEGHVTVDKQAYKHWYWKTYVVKHKVCKAGKSGDKKVCKVVFKKHKKRAWVWKHRYVFTVDSTLYNNKWWGNKKCAWETFKVVNHDGHAYFKSFRNCEKFPAHYSFSGKDAAHIYVDVSRGHFGGPSGHHSGWKDVYHAAP